jgi:hypothetical protein
MLVDLQPVGAAPRVADNERRRDRDPAINRAAKKATSIGSSPVWGGTVGCSRMGSAAMRSVPVMLTTGP